MRWQGGREGGNIEDRRGMGPVAVGGMGVGGLVLALIGYFVFGISPEDTTIVEHIIGMARGLGMTTVAEGIETEEQAAMLKGLGCHLGQGYLYCPPRPPAVIEQLLRTPADEGWVPGLRTVLPTTGAPPPPAAVVTSGAAAPEVPGWYPQDAGNGAGAPAATTGRTDLFR